MTRVFVLFLLAGWLVFAFNGYLVGYVEDYVNSSVTRVFLLLDNGSLVPVAGAPWDLVGAGVRVSAEGVLEGGVLYLSRVEPLAPVRSEVVGVLPVAVVALKFSDVADEPYNYSYIHDVVFGPGPSVRDFWEWSSGGRVRIRPYHLHFRWEGLGMSTDQFCSDANRFARAAQRAIEVLYNYGVVLRDKSYLIIVLNAVPSCEAGIAGRGTIRFWPFDTPYGRRWVAVSWIYHYADRLKAEPDVEVYVHEFGHNLGLCHSGTAQDDYDNKWDVMSDGWYRAWLDRWWGRTYYLVPVDTNVYHKYYLGWAELAGGGLLRAGVRGLVWGSGPYLVGDYRCRAGLYDGLLPFCGLSFYLVNETASGRWAFFQRIYGKYSLDSFLDVGQVASVGGFEVYVTWRNSTHAFAGVGRPTLRDLWQFANASFVVGGGAAAIDSIGAAVVSGVFSPVLYNQIWQSFLPAFSSYLDSEWPGGFVFQRRMSAGFPLPSVVVSVGGPSPNALTRALNPPGGLGADGLPFYYDPSVGGIRDGRTGAYWTSDAAVVASVVKDGRLFVLVWGLSGFDTYRASVWLRDCVPPPARGVVLRTSDFYILASWPAGFQGPSTCRGRVYDEVAVVGEAAASIDAVGAAMLAAGNGALDSWVLGPNGSLMAREVYIYAVGGPYPNKLTGLYNPPDRPGFAGLPFYYSTSAGGIRYSGGYCTTNCFVVASLRDGGRRIILVWGINGDDTRTAALYAALNKQQLKTVRGNVAYVVRWGYQIHAETGKRVGVVFEVLDSWQN